MLARDGYRLLVVDDGVARRDGADRRRSGRASIPGRIDVMHRTGPRGLGRAYIDGLRAAIADGRADLICQMDADLSHNPEYCRRWRQPRRRTTW